MPINDNSKNNTILGQALSALTELKEDNTVPRNIKLKIDAIITMLNNNGDISMNINKALNELDEISNDNNLQAYTRTQIWNIVSILESQ
ncbi:MAG: UPF0147 family protein [archaeon]